MKCWKFWRASTPKDSRPRNNARVCKTRGILHDNRRTNGNLHQFPGHRPHPFLENLERTAKQTKCRSFAVKCRAFKSILKDETAKENPGGRNCRRNSAVFMAQYGEPDAEITTIENYEKRIPIARENFEKSGFADRITVIPGRRCRVLKPWTGRMILSSWTPPRDNPLPAGSFYACSTNTAC